MFEFLTVNKVDQGGGAAPRSILEAGGLLWVTGYWLEYIA